RATRPPGPSLTLGVTLARRPVDAPAVARAQAGDPLVDRNLRHLAPAANPRRLAAAQLLLLRGVEKMDERQVAPPPHPPVQRGALPELVVLASPADDRFVEAADLEVRALRRDDARSLQVLH